MKLVIDWFPDPREKREEWMKCRERGNFHSTIFPHYSTVSLPFTSSPLTLSKFHRDNTIISIQGHIKLTQLEFDDLFSAITTTDHYTPHPLHSWKPPPTLLLRLIFFPSLLHYIQYIVLTLLPLPRVTPPMPARHAHISPWALLPVDLKLLLCLLPIQSLKILLLVRSLPSRYSR